MLWFFWFLHDFKDFFFTGGNDFWETPDFKIFVTVNCNFMVFLDFTVFVVFFTGSNDFLETPDFYIFVGGKPHFFVHYYTLLRE